jgi:hypothetical protein
MAKKDLPVHARAHGTSSNLPEISSAQIKNILTLVYLKQGDDQDDIEHA